MGHQDVRLAIGIEALVIWAVRDQCCDREIPAMFEAGLSRSGGDGVAALMRRARLGRRVDGGGAYAGRPSSLHPDAEAVADALDRLDFETKQLVEDQARIGEAPVWSAGPQALVPVAGGTGSHVVVHEWEPAPAGVAVVNGKAFGPDGRLPAGSWCLRRDARCDGTLVETVHVRVSYCPVRAEPPAEYCEFVNLLYRRWWRGLRRLQRLIAVESRPLLAHRLTPFDLCAQPWVRP